MFLFLNIFKKKIKVKNEILQITVHNAFDCYFSDNISVYNLVFHDVYGVGHQAEGALVEGCPVPVRQDQPRPAGHPTLRPRARYPGALLKFVPYYCEINFIHVDRPEKSFYPGRGSNL